MTAYARLPFTLKDKKVIIELKTLNGKQFDINIRLPQMLRQKEIAIRDILYKTIERGKTELVISFENISDNKDSVINKDFITKRFYELKDLAHSIGITNDAEVFASVLRMPDVLNIPDEDLNDTIWKEFEKNLITVSNMLDKYRFDEGYALEIDIKERIFNIQNLVDDLKDYEEERIEKLREKMLNGINKSVKEGEEIDHNRFEQELIYYLEKLDINEEKIRLRQHCTYFLETIKDVLPTGKKLAFIAQEIGREINTIGAKSNHALMQKTVVLMKDELEKIKELLMNIL